jgi:hypothetical protein
MIFRYRNYRYDTRTIGVGHGKRWPRKAGLIFSFFDELFVKECVVLSSGQRVIRPYHPDSPHQNSAFRTPFLVETSIFRTSSLLTPLLPYFHWSLICAQFGESLFDTKICSSSRLLSLLRSSLGRSRFSSAGLGGRFWCFGSLLSSGLGSTFGTVGRGPEGEVVAEKLHDEGAVPV